MILRKWEAMLKVPHLSEAMPPSRTNPEAPGRTGAPGGHRYHEDDRPGAHTLKSDIRRRVEAPHGLEWPARKEECDGGGAGNDRAEGKEAAQSDEAS